jgi:hypothetical protein
MASVPESFTAKLAAAGLVGGLIYATVNELKFGEFAPPEAQPGADMRRPGANNQQLDPTLRFTRFLGDANNSQIYYRDALEEKDLDERTFDEADYVEAVDTVDTQGTKLLFGAAVVAYFYYQMRG